MQIRRGNFQIKLYWKLKKLYSTYIIWLIKHLHKLFTYNNFVYKPILLYITLGFLIFDNSECDYVWHNSEDDKQLNLKALPQ